MKILYVTTISLTMNSFFKPHIEMLVNEGHHVDLACNYRDLALDTLYATLGCDSFQIDFSRSPLSPNNIKAYSQLSEVIKKGKYDIVHCHTPNASVITRLVCKRLRKRSGLKVFYTAHGFHFYKGAPMLNWLIYYPIEKICSRYTDKLITINGEDYELANNKFRAKEVCYVPGVGIDLSKFANVQVDKKSKRREIGVPEEAIVLISVGELNENKNHQLIIRAVASLGDPNVHYVIAGLGDKKDYLLQLSKELGVAEQVHLLGYREDIPELNYASDIFCFPSIREGLPVALIEAMSCGLPVLCSRIRGNTDLINDSGGKLFDKSSSDDFLNALKFVLKNDKENMGNYNKNNAQKYSVEENLRVMCKLYGKA